MTSTPAGTTGAPAGTPRGRKLTVLLQNPEGHQLLIPLSEKEQEFILELLSNSYEQADEFMMVVPEGSESVEEAEARIDAEMKFLSDLYEKLTGKDITE